VQRGVKIVLDITAGMFFGVQVSQMIRKSHTEERAVDLIY